jgi:hypothetical protein
MKHINSYDKFNEGIGKTIATAALGAALLTTSCGNKGPVKVEYEETDINKFPEYYITTLGNEHNINLTVSPDGVIGSKYSEGSGKTRHSEYTITIGENIDHIYYKTSTWGGHIYGTYDRSNLPGSDRVEINGLEVVEETSTYKILEVPGFWSSFNYILINKGYKDKSREFKIGNKTYTYLDFNKGWFTHAKFVIEVK